jgi:adenylate cyclase, class 2
VGNFEDANVILNKLGYSYKNYQENRRISYILGKTHIEIDYWPMIPAYLEIEGESKESVEKTLERLGFTVSQTTSVNTFEVYRKYGFNIEEIKDLRFKEINK